MPVEQYPDESVIAAKLNAWRQWKRGDGVKGQIAVRTWCEDEALLRREMNRDNFRLPALVSDAEHTDRAVARMAADDRKGWLALQCYHLVSSESRCVARACKAHHAEVRAILYRAHANFRYYRDLTMKISINPAPTKA